MRARALALLLAAFLLLAAVFLVDQQQPPAATGALDAEVASSDAAAAPLIPELAPATDDAVDTGPVEADAERAAIAPDSPRIVGSLLGSRGDPVADGQLLVEFDGSDPVAFPFVSDPESGRFEVALSRPGELRVVAARSPLTAARSDSLYFDIERGETVDVETLTLPSEDTIAGRVVWTDGTPVSGVSVAAYRIFEDGSSWRGPSGFVFPDGRFRIIGLMEERYELRPGTTGSMRFQEPCSFDAGELNAEVVAEAARITVECWNDDDVRMPFEELDQRITTVDGRQANRRTRRWRGVQSIEATVADVADITYTAIGAGGERYHGRFEGPFNDGTHRHVLRASTPDLGSVCLRLAESVPEAASLRLWRVARRSDGKVFQSNGSRAVLDGEGHLEIESPVLPPGEYTFMLELRGADAMVLERDSMVHTVRGGEREVVDVPLVEGGWVVLSRSASPARVDVALQRPGRSWLGLLLIEGTDIAPFLAGRLPANRAQLNAGPWATQPIAPGAHVVRATADGYETDEHAVTVESGRGTWVDVRMERSSED